MGSSRNTREVNLVMGHRNQAVYALVYSGSGTELRHLGKPGDSDQIAINLSELYSDEKMNLTSNPSGLQGYVRVPRGILKKVRGSLMTLDIKAEVI